MVKSQILKEYLEKYAGDEYVFPAGLHISTTGRFLVFRLMEKSVFSYHYITENIPAGFIRHIVKYNDGTEKLLNEINGEVDDIIRDKEELKKLDFFNCTNIEYIDMVGSNKKELTFVRRGNVIETLNIGDTANRNMLVATSKSVDRIINEKFEKDLVSYLNNKK